MNMKRIYKGMLLLAIFSVIIGIVNATIQETASMTTTATQTVLTPTNVVLDYDLTHIDSNLKPGDSGVLQVVVKNVGLQSAENVQVYIPGTSDVHVDRRWDVGRIDPLSTKTVSTTVSISKDASIGLHTLQVRISYDGYDSKGNRKNNQLSLWDFPLRTYGKANFKVDVEKADFFEDISEKLVIIGSTQDGARDISATLSSSCASILGSSKSYMGNLGKGENFKLEYLIQPVSVGVCSLNLILDYSDASGNPLTETLLVGIDVNRYDVDFKITNVIYENTNPGTVSNISIEINNVGSAPADDVSVTLDLESPFTAVGSSDRYAGKIKGHETKKINFQAMIDSTADIKAYDVPISIDYFDSAGLKHTVKKSIGIQVSGKPEIKLILEKADLFTSGSKGKITINVVNKGFAEVKFLNLKLLPTGNYNMLSSTEAYIGNLDSDATDTQEFEIQIKDNVPAGKIPLKLEVSYKEKNSNIDHIDTVDLDLNILSVQEYASKQPTGSAVSLIITGVSLLVGLIVVGLVLWFVYKLLLLFTGYIDRKIFKRKV